MSSREGIDESYSYEDKYKQFAFELFPVDVDPNEYKKRIVNPSNYNSTSVMVHDYINN